MKVKEFITILKEHDLNKDFVIYSNEQGLMNYDFLGLYENEGQVEIYINEGEKLESYTESIEEYSRKNRSERATMTYIKKLCKDEIEKNKECPYEKITDSTSEICEGRLEFAESVLKILKEKK
jgi:hypothetical protein